MLRAMIVQHFNHPSIILWGLGNENGWPGDFETFDQNTIRGYMTELNLLAHQLDPSRQTCIRYCEFCKDIPDVYSPSIWAGWYSGRYTDYRGALEQAIKATPHFFHAEWGGDSQAGRFAEEPEKFMAQVVSAKDAEEIVGAYKRTGGKARPDKDGDWSESYIANLFDWHLKEQEQMTNLAGTAQWIFRDFATPLRPENPVPRVNQKGLTQRDGTLKEGYFIFQSYWSDKPMVHILGHGWLTRWGKPDEKKVVEVFSNCRDVELFVNGVSAGIRQRDITNFPAAGLHWFVKLNTGSNTLRAVAHPVGGSIEDEIQVGYQAVAWSAPTKMSLQEISRKDNVVTLEARVFDASNVPCLDAANIVRFGVTGEGHLLDDLGTVGGSRVVQLSNGRAQIQLQLTGQEAVASVTSDGLPASFVHLTTSKQFSINVQAIDRERILSAANVALQLTPHQYHTVSSSKVGKVWVRRFLFQRRLFLARPDQAGRPALRQPRRRIESGKFLRAPAGDAPVARRCCRARRCLQNHQRRPLRSQGSRIVGFLFPEPDDPDESESSVRTSRSWQYARP